MSTVVRDKVDAKTIKEEHVSVEKKKQCLQTGIFNVIKKAPMLGSILQCLNIEYSHIVPRAGIMFDADGKKWKMLINPWWFCNCLSDKNRQAVLLHEIYHITHKHPSRLPFLKINKHRRTIMNIAMDMAINQYIDNLPKGCDQCPPSDEQFKGEKCENRLCPGGCIDVNEYDDEDDNGLKTPWEKFQTTEYYYHKLIEKFKDSEEGESDGQEGDGEKGNGMPQEFDSHSWDSNAEESEMLDATEDLVKRAMQKRSTTYDLLPKHLKELLDDIESRRNELNYKQLILSAIKRHASGINRKHSWTRRSKRFGLKSPGTKYSELPFLYTYIDSSGSISIQEANDFLDIIDNFLKVGSRKCNISLFHTDVYHSREYKLGDRLSQDVWQSGGTNLEPVMKSIYKNKPDLAIILTDGYYENVEVEQFLRSGESFPQCLFIISRDGKEDHPLKRLGETIIVPNID